MAKIIFVNRFFYPDQSATSQLLTDLALVLSKDLNEVHVITSRTTITNGREQLSSEDIIGGVAIHRVGRPALQKSGLAARLLKFISFYWRAAFQARRHATNKSIVIVKTDPPLLSVWAWLVLRDRDVRIVNWLQDIYPEIAMRCNVPIIRGPL
jgi:colanic acid biosynthesis glycosyl transferase WcaI